MSFRYLVSAVVLVLAFPSFVQGEEPSAVGRVKVVSGSAFLMRENQSVFAHVGQPVFEGGTLRTGTTGRIGVTLKDDTRVALGPASELRLDRYVYAPAEGRLGLALKIVRGVAAYVSGQIAKLSPDSVRLETPASIVGVRGTTLVFRVDPAS